LEEESVMLDEVLKQAMQGGVMIVSPPQEKFTEKLGKSVALSTVHRMLVRHGWRTLAPDTEHLKVICKRAKAGKKLLSTLTETVALWNNVHPLRLMFQDEARFGCISDTRYC
jgi:hypothetical protein